MNAPLRKKLVFTNLPWAGLELGSLGPQAGMLVIEPPLLVGRFSQYVFGTLVI